MIASTSSCKKVETLNLKIGFLLKLIFQFKRKDTTPLPHPLFNVVTLKFECQMDIITTLLMGRGGGDALT